MAGRQHPLSWQAAGLLVWSIVPIALAYHIAHYLTSLLVDGQYAIAALSDPFGLGWNLFGTAHMQIEAGIVAGADIGVDSVEYPGRRHHRRPRACGSRRARACVSLAPDPVKAALSQFPLTLLMIGYTVFGLWLLATPTAG